MKTPNNCELCGKPGDELYGFSVCKSCKSALNLHTDATIETHVRQMIEMGNHSYEAEVRSRLVYLEKDYIKKKIKLLHILSRLESEL